MCQNLNRSNVPIHETPFLQGSISYTRHICRVSHTQMSPIACGARLYVRDQAYMPSTRYNFSILMLWHNFFATMTKAFFLSQHTFLFKRKGEGRDTIDTKEKVYFENYIKSRMKKKYE